MRLGAGELAVAAVVGLVTPDPRALGEHGVLAGEHPGVIGPPPPAVNDDLVADLDVLHVLARGPHDTRAVAAARVEVLGLAQPLALGDDVEGLAESGPDIVVVDAGGHHVDQHLVGPDSRRGNDLPLPRIPRLTETVLPDEVRVHPRRHFAERRLLADVVEICHRLLRFEPTCPESRRACAPRRPASPPGGPRTAAGLPPARLPRRARHRARARMF